MNALCVKLLWLASCFCILCVSQDFFTDFYRVAKAARGEICNGTSAVVQGASCKTIGCASAFNNVTETEKVFIVLWVSYCVREHVETMYSYSLSLLRGNSWMIASLRLNPFLSMIKWWHTESTCSLSCFSNYAENIWCGSLLSYQLCGSQCNSCHIESCRKEMHSKAHTEWRTIHVLKFFIKTIFM